MKKIVVFLMVTIAMVAVMVITPKKVFAQMAEVEFVNTVPAELASSVTIAVDESLDTALMTMVNKYPTTIVDPITLKGIGVDNKYTPARGRWVLPDSVTTIYVLFTYDNKTFSNSFELKEGKTVINLTAELIGLMRPGKSEFKSDMLTIVNKSGFDIKIKTAESNLKFPLNGVLISKDGSTYTKLPSESGIYHFLIQSLQNGSADGSAFVATTTKTAFITNTTTIVTITDADVKSKTSEDEAVSVRIVNNTGYPIALTMPVMKTKKIGDKKTSISEPTDIFVGPYSKTRAWYDVNLGSLVFHAELSSKNSTFPYELQTTVVEGQKVITITGGTRYGLKVEAASQSSSAYTY